MNVVSWYLVNAANKMLMIWEATTPDQDCQTPINLTNHAYWNLSGDFRDSTVDKHSLTLKCDNVLPMGPTSIPTGEIMPVQGTPFDFTGEFSDVGDRERLTGAIDGGGMPGIDHAFLVNRDHIDSGSFSEVGALRHETSGRQMRIWTTQPAAVVYTTNWLPANDFDGIHRQHAAICLETCMLPNAINMLGTAGWPSSDKVILSKDSPYKHVTMHEFTNLL